ncbi:hypothetical protein [Apibacter sp. HY039]|uniref:hypothetical protein n=1 Tax=Apibacter sp. HY039 TaxID=2501476 RepID=UPI000FEC0B1C|nr:hypothetical protein [Apibacter sp. HY039]
MKYIGFIKEFDDVIFAKEFKDCVTHIYRDNTGIIKYLEKGTYFGGWMEAVTEVENDDIFVSNLEYFTDGEWVWPAYYSYYLKKYQNFYVSPKFLEHINKNKEKQINLTEKELLNMEKMFFIEYKKEEFIENDTLSKQLKTELETYKTYKGKNYTEEEWKIFKERLYLEYFEKE